MFVTCVQLLSAAWGMSCCAAKHYTQQPTLLSPDSTSFFHSISVTSFWFISDFVYFLYVPCLCPCPLSPPSAKKLIGSGLFTSHVPTTWDIYLIQPIFTCFVDNLSWKSDCAVTWCIRKTNTPCICLFPRVLSGCIVTWQLRNREIMNYLVKWYVRQRGAECLGGIHNKLSDSRRPDSWPFDPHMSKPSDSMSNFLTWQLHSNDSFRSIQQLADLLIVQAVGQINKIRCPRLQNRLRRTEAPF